jgi:hypothetical protein
MRSAGASGSAAADDDSDEETSLKSFNEFQQLSNQTERVAALYQATLQNARAIRRIEETVFTLLDLCEYALCEPLLSLGLASHPYNSCADYLQS